MKGRFSVSIIRFMFLRVDELTRGRVDKGGCPIYKGFIGKQTIFLVTLLTCHLVYYENLSLRKLQTSFDDDSLARRIVLYNSEQYPISFKPEGEAEGADPVYVMRFQFQRGR